MAILAEKWSKAFYLLTYLAVIWLGHILNFKANLDRFIANSDENTASY